MKKRALMIFIIILVILLIPRNNRNGYRTKSNHGQRFPQRKMPRETDDFELPFPGNWLLNNIVPNNSFNAQYAFDSYLSGQFISLTLISSRQYLMINTA